MAVCICEPQHGRHQAAIWRDGDQVRWWNFAAAMYRKTCRSYVQVCVKLKTRKNLPNGSGVIVRGCTCKGGPGICPVHVLWVRHLRSLSEGCQPWAGVSAKQALYGIRNVLVHLSASASLVRPLCARAHCLLVALGT